jgi:hypothetical protein
LGKFQPLTINSKPKTANPKPNKHPGSMAGMELMGTLFGFSLSAEAFSPTSLKRSWVAKADRPCHF